MKSKFILLVIGSILFHEKIDAQVWNWSKQIGGSDFDTPKYSCIDAGGNLYVTGSFFSNPCFFETDSLVPNGHDDYFIIKLDPNGNRIWVRSFGGNNGNMQQENFSALQYDQISNTLVLSGTYYGTSIYGTDTLTGYPGGFLARIDTGGNFIWVKKLSHAAFLTVDNSSNIYAEFFLTATSSIDTFIASPGIWLVKFDSVGNLQWTKKIFNTNLTSYGFDAYFTNIEVRGDKIFGIGFCSVDTFTVDTVHVDANLAIGQCIIGCFDTSAAAYWVKPIAGYTSNGTFNLIVGNDNSIYTTGSFSHEGFFGSDTLHADSGLAEDIFIAKYDSMGTNIWAMQGNAEFGIGQSLCFDNEGGFYVTGIIMGSATFGSYTINSNANGDLIVARFDTSGGCIGLKHLGKANGYNVLCDNNGFVYATGTFYNTVTFDINPSLTSYGQTDIYIAKSDAITGIGEEERRSNHLVIYANPNEGKCNITIPDEFRHEKKLTLSIIDNTGKLIQQGNVQMNEDKVHVNLEAEAKGIYNVTLSNGKKSYGGKIVFE